MPAQPDLFAESPPSTLHFERQAQARGFRAVAWKKGDTSPFFCILEKIAPVP
jgi:hypothetical protein